MADYNLDEAREFCERVFGRIEDCTDLRERERIENALVVLLEEYESPRVGELEEELRVSQLEDRVSDLESDLYDARKEERGYEDERDDLQARLEQTEEELEALRESHTEDDFGERP